MAMARYFDVHPQDEQPHRIAQVVAMLRDGDARRVTALERPLAAPTTLTR